MLNLHRQSCNLATIVQFSDSEQISTLHTCVEIHIKAAKIMTYFIEADITVDVTIQVPLTFINT